MLLSVAVVALMGAMPCNLSLLAPASAPARFEASAPVSPLQGGCGELPEGSDSAVGRRVVSALVGTLGSVGGAVAGGMLGYAIGAGCGGECTFGPGELWVGALIGLHVGAGLGAHLAGSSLGGRGTWQGTVLGTIAGGLVGMLMLALTSSMTSDTGREGSMVLVPVALLMPTAGAVTGYALSEPDAPGPCASPEQSPRAPMLRLRFSF